MTNKSIMISVLCLTGSALCGVSVAAKKGQRPGSMSSSGVTTRAVAATQRTFRQHQRIQSQMRNTLAAIRKVDRLKYEHSVLFKKCKKTVFRKIYLVRAGCRPHEYDTTAARFRLAGYSYSGYGRIKVARCSTLVLRRCLGGIGRRIQKAVRDLERKSTPVMRFLLKELSKRGVNKSFSYYRR